MELLDDKYFNRLRDSIVGSCTKCHGSGFLHNQTCPCMIEFRARHRLLIGNFSEHLLTLDPNWIQKNIEFDKEGEHYVQFFLKNPQFVKEQGLNLYIWSEKRGVGKTTLSHVIAKEMAKFYATEENYSRSNRYRFMEVGEFFDIARKGSGMSYNEFVFDWNSTLFVLDDFGNEDKSARWDFEFISKLIQDFLRHRTRLRLSTIITTNLRPPNVGPQYQADISSLLELQSNGKIGGLLWREVYVAGRDIRLDRSMSPWKVVDEGN